MNLIPLTLAKATPLLLATLGGLLSESAGVINFALEGMMLAGAFGAVWAAFAMDSAWMGLAAGAFAGAAIAAMHGLACLKLRANEIVSSIALNLFAAGVTGMLLHHVFEAYGTSPTVKGLPTLDLSTISSMPIIGSVSAPLEGLSTMVPLTLLFTLGFVQWFKRSSAGLRLQACGENPLASTAVGLPLFRIRFSAVLCSGFLAGIAGAYLSIGELSQFVENMTQGRGYLAIATLILARWRPVGVILASLFFGFTEALSELLAVAQPWLSFQLFLALPYFACLVLLAFRLGKRKPPSALGQPWR
jgi:simple sugar transport system permease protein